MKGQAAERLLMECKMGGDICMTHAGKTGRAKRAKQMKNRVSKETHNRKTEPWQQHCAADCQGGKKGEHNQEGQG